jgi:hypothetical protein
MLVSKALIFITLCFENKLMPEEYMPMLQSFAANNNCQYFSYTKDNVYSCTAGGEATVFGVECVNFVEKKDKKAEKSQTIK